MRKCLVIVWLVSMIGSDVSGGDPALRRSESIDLPAAFRSVRRLPIRPSRNPARTGSTFDLRLVVSSKEDLVEFVPPIRVEQPTDRAGIQSQIEANAGDPQASIEIPSETGLPTLADSPEPLPPAPTIANEPSVPLIEVPRPLKIKPIPLDEIFRDNGGTKDEKKPDFADRRSSLGWIAGNQNNLGITEFDSETLSRVRYQGFGDDNECKFHLDDTFGARWLNGPNSPDLPPYLFNILINVGATIQISDRFAIDAVISPGWYTDFSNKGIEAFRLPWHFVTFTKANDDWQWVLGITDLSRRDIRLLPVAGFIYAPGSGDVQLDLVFPKPKAAWRAFRRDEYKHGNFKISKHEGWVYLAGELGGGSWAISRSDRAYDVVTYRDYRLIAGLESREKNGHASRIEVGWIFGRAVEYMSNNGNYNPPDSLMIRVSSDY